ncbi:hypothetical protein [Moorella sulfitireducens (nom. illeg.)]|uniref:hypothetical protein n=1 Tax=Neomoorella sulfitireducens TaxID=2972948 RepID=UPI0021ABC911|nr:hypothetical protein [Moorella sulfitireducens]
MSFWRGFIAGSIVGAIIGSTFKCPRETPPLPADPVTVMSQEETVPDRPRGVVRRRSKGRL